MEGQSQTKGGKGGIVFGVINLLLIIGLGIGLIIVGVAVFGGLVSDEIFFYDSDLGVGGVIPGDGFMDTAETAHALAPIKQTITREWNADETEIMSLNRSLYEGNAGCWYISRYQGKLR